MKKLEKLLNKYNEIYISLTDENKKEFLQFAKNNNFIWINGSKINPLKDTVGYHVYINKNKKLGIVSCVDYITNKNVKKLIF